MHEGEATLACRAVSKVSHEARASEGKIALSVVGIVEECLRNICKLGMHGIKYLLDGRCTLGTFTEEVFVARLTIKFNDSQPCTFLPAVVLFLHEEVELV